MIIHRSQHHDRQGPCSHDTDVPDVPTPAEERGSPSDARDLISISLVALVNDVYNAFRDFLLILVENRVKE